MLVKGMSSKKHKIPAIRFKGFTDAWEQRELGDTVEFFSGLTYSPDNVVEKPGTLVLRSSNVQNGEIVNADNVYVNNEVVNSDNVQVGDIVVVVRNGSRSLIGKHATIKSLMKETVIGAFMTGVRSDTPSFTNALLDSKQFEIEIAKNLGATINQITTGNFKKMAFNFPKVDERLKIGGFFNQLDNTIDLHQRQLDNYNQLKKAMMQKIFNQELRFKDQDGNNYPEWKTTTLDKICTIKTGNMNVQDSVSDGKYAFFDRSETIKKLNEYSYDEEALIYPGEGSSFYPRYFKGKYALHQRAYSLSDFEEGCNARYVYHYLNTKNNHFLKTCVGTTVRSLRMTSFESCEVELPSYLEQHEIADFLSAIDKRLEKLEQTVELLKEQKKGLMQQMFC